MKYDRFYNLSWIPWVISLLINISLYLVYKKKTYKETQKNIKNSKKGKIWSIISLVISLLTTLIVFLYLISKEDCDKKLLTSNIIYFTITFAYTIVEILNITKKYNFSKFSLSLYILSFLFYFTTIRLDKKYKCGSKMSATVGIAPPNDNKINSSSRQLL
jgi:hypothetical protein